MTTGKLQVGELVEVRSKEEILRTLDSDGQLDGMPFMPEMFAFCGMKFRVFKRAHKTCDTVFPVRGRRVESTVHLETRCDGAAHSGCQAGCLIFWKQAWIKRTGTDSSVDVGAVSAAVCSEQDVIDRTQAPDSSIASPTYMCQATRLPYATTRLDWWDLRQYCEDYWSGNVGLWRIFKGVIYSSYYNLSQAGIGVGAAMRWLYDRVVPLWGGTLFPRRTGAIPEGQPTPAETLNLQPGEYVRVKSFERILSTLTTAGKNRGMGWDAELVPYCGGTYRVLRRVTKIINEQTGKMQDMKNPCIILDSVVCQARYSECRLFCPRAIYSYWREIWLERADPDHSENV